LISEEYYSKDTIIASFILFLMARAIRTYDHFCSLARTLERVGDRWTLLVVRDLLGGPRRFTDLMARLGGITPKTLTQRLRELAEDGIVEVDRAPGRREVWYRLTPAGADLGPAVASLTLWGLRHAGRPPLPGEAVHPEHLLQAVRIVLNRTPPPPDRPTWRFRFADDGEYTLGFDGLSWIVDLQDRTEAADLVIDTTTQAWAQFLLTPPDRRGAAEQGMEIQGPPANVDRFVQLLARFPRGAG
jgi:DNA-binding HxlR family transcriptional regulator